jgi:hypothetical protein
MVQKTNQKPPDDARPANKAESFFSQLAHTQRYVLPHNTCCAKMLTNHNHHRNAAA